MVTWNSVTQSVAINVVFEGYLVDCNRHRDWQRERQRDIEKERKRERQKDRKREREKDRKREREKERHTDRQTDKVSAMVFRGLQQKNRETDTQTNSRSVSHGYLVDCKYLRGPSIFPFLCPNMFLSWSLFLVTLK